MLISVARRETVDLRSARGRCNTRLRMDVLPCPYRSGIRPRPLDGAPRPAVSVHGVMLLATLGGNRSGQLWSRPPALTPVALGRPDALLGLVVVQRSLIRSGGSWLVVVAIAVALLSYGVDAPIIRSVHGTDCCSQRRPRHLCLPLPVMW